MIKKHYEIPESELLLVKFEEAFLLESNPTVETGSDPRDGYGEEIDLG